MKESELVISCVVEEDEWREREERIIRDKRQEEKMGVRSRKKCWVLRMCFGEDEPKKEKEGERKKNKIRK